jgi:hypothetical protein
MLRAWKAAVVFKQKRGKKLHLYSSPRQSSLLIEGTDLDIQYIAEL